MPGTGATLGEALLLCRDRSSGLAAVIAVDDTTLGPGLGGVRWMPYRSLADAAEEACRLSRVMTLKNALAGIPYGGAKSVILRQGQESDDARQAQLLAFAVHVRQLGGTYVPGVDMGTSVADLATMASVAPWVSCNHDDPSPATAQGVFHAIAATVRQTQGRDLRGVRVVMQGAGHVGASLAMLLSAQGARVAVADVDAARAAAVAGRAGGVVVSPDSVLTEPCDVLAPCAMARILSPPSIAALRCGAVVGAANDVLATRDCAELLAGRGIVYVPDFVSNAGGVLQIHAERAGWEPAQLDEVLAGLGRRTTMLLAEAAASGVTPLRVAERWASEHLGRPVTIPD